MSITTQQHEPENGALRAATGAWSPVEFHQAGGARIAVARRGRGPVVVCLHATGHGGRDFEEFAARVGDAFKVVAVDWPGQGLSPACGEAASAAFYARLLEDLLPRVAGGPAILVGCSIGGAAALELASRRKDLVRALVLCDPGGLLPVDATVRLATRAMSAFFAAGARGAFWYPKAFELYYRMVLPAPAARGQRGRIVAAAVETAPILAEAWTSFGQPDADLRPRIAHVACPVLVAWAKNDRVLPWARCKSAALQLRDVRVELFDGGHAAFLEDPARFEGVFRAFAASLPAIEPAAGTEGGSREVLTPG